MALQSSGAISYSDIKDEFGEPNDKNIGAYRVSKNIGELSSLPLDTGIPQGTSPISFSDFYGKQLNIVVDFHSGGTVTRQNARTQYNNNNVTVVGGFRSKPAVNSTGWQGGKKVIIHVNKLIGSVVHNSNNTRVALRTGAWQSGTDLVIDVGGEGRIWGAGGKGGDGRRTGGPFSADAIAKRKELAKATKEVAKTFEEYTKGALNFDGANRKGIVSTRELATRMKDVAASAGITSKKFELFTQGATKFNFSAQIKSLQRFNESAKITASTFGAMSSGNVPGVAGFSLSLIHI